MEVDKNKPVGESVKMDVIEKEREVSSDTEKENEASADIKKENEDDAGIKKENGTGVEANSNEVNSSLQGKIIRFVEMVFGDYNLMKDTLLKKEVLLDDGWVSPATLFKLYADHISWLNESVPVIIEALKKSGLIEVCMQTGRIRRSPEKPLPDTTPEKDLEIGTRTVYCKGFPRDGMDIEKVLEFFSQYPTTENIQMRYFENEEDQLVFKGSVTVTFGTREQAETFMSLDVVKYKDYPLARQWFADWKLEKEAEYETREANKVLIQNRTVYCKGFPRDGMDIDKVLEFFIQYPTAENVQMRYFENEHGYPIFKGSLTATFVTREQAETFMCRDVVKYNDSPIARQWCADWEVEKTAENEEREAIEAFMRGTILKLTGIPVGTDREKIEEALAGTSAHVCIVDFLPDHVALVLIHGEANVVLDQLDDGKITIGGVRVEASVLEGEEEKAALMEIKDRMDNSSNSQGYDSDQDYDEDSFSEEPSAATDEKSQESPEPGNPAEKARGD